MMSTVSKKNQIINQYFKEITPYLDTKSINDGSKFECAIKNVYIDNQPFVLDFTNSSIKDIYCKLQSLHHQIWDEL
jgi:hypothetical protein